MFDAIRDRRTLFGWKHTLFHHFPLREDGLQGSTSEIGVQKQAVSDPDTRRKCA
jgi:hypothetical protein